MCIHGSKWKSEKDIERFAECYTPSLDVSRYIQILTNLKNLHGMEGVYNCKLRVPPSLKYTFEI
jgi:hypothetical protein